MNDYKKQAKIVALNKAFPGMGCGNSRCEEFCAEAFDAAKAMHLDPAEAIRKTIEQELYCHLTGRAKHTDCRFKHILQNTPTNLNQDEDSFQAKAENSSKKNILVGTIHAMLSTALSQGFLETDEYFQFERELEKCKADDNIQRTKELYNKVKGILQRKGMDTSRF